MSQRSMYQSIVNNERNLSCSSLSALVADSAAFDPKKLDQNLLRLFLNMKDCEYVLLLPHQMPPVVYKTEA